MCFNWWKSAPDENDDIPVGVQRNLRVCKNKDDKAFSPPSTSTPRSTRKQSPPPTTPPIRDKKVTFKDSDSTKLVQDCKVLVRHTRSDNLFERIWRRHSESLMLDQRLWDWRTEVGNTARTAPTPDLKIQYSENLNLLLQHFQKAVHIATSLNLILTKTKSSSDPESRDRSRSLIERQEQIRQCLYPVMLHQVNNLLDLDHHSQATLLLSSEMKLNCLMQL